MGLEPLEKGEKNFCPLQNSFSNPCIDYLRFPKKKGKIIFMEAPEYFP